VRNKFQVHFGAAVNGNGRGNGNGRKNGKVKATAAGKDIATAAGKDIATAAGKDMAKAKAKAQPQGWMRMLVLLCCGLGGLGTVAAGCSKVAPKAWRALRTGKLKKADRMVTRELKRDKRSTELWDLKLRIDLIKRDWASAQKSYAALHKLISANERRAALELLVAQTLWAALKCKQPAVAEKAARLARDLDVSGLEEVLLDLREQGSARMRARVAGALWPGRFEGFLQLMKLSHHLSAAVRAEVAAGLAQKPESPKAFDLLARLVKDGAPRVREAAVDALGAVDPKQKKLFFRAVELLVGVLLDPVGSVRAAAARHLARWGRRVGWKWVKRALSDPDMAVRLSSVRALKKQKVDRAQYLELADAKDVYVALRAAVALAERKNETKGAVRKALLEKIAAVLLRAWADKQWNVRAAALNAASSMKGVAQAAALIEKGLADPHRRVRLAAGRAALNRKVQREKAKKVLLALMQKKDAVAASAAHVLARKKAKKAVLRLKKLAVSGTPSGRRTALRALGDVRKGQRAVVAAWAKGPWAIRLAAAAVLQRRFRKKRGGR
jgi:HEAT repeat protein